ncbi:MAG: FAD-binding protein, partial [Lachnospiraceae bacterium]|nr:FAD-binding protein [Lachnospiraceae bacterium]
GDIGGSEELCRKYAPEALATAGHLYNPPGANTGDGHLMGSWAGGVMQDAPFPTTLHPQYLSRLQYFYLFVGPDGKRFMNEDTWVQSRSLAAMRQDGGYAFSVFDSKWPEEVEKSLPAGGGLFWDNGRRRLGEKWTPDGDKKLIDSYIKNGSGFTAQTIEELAHKMNVPFETFRKTVDRYNDLVRSGKDTDFGKRPELLTSITEPPFYAMKFAAATLCIVGGLLTDLKYHVLRANGDIVKGLYAIGNVSGGLYASDYPLLIPGSTHGRALLSGCTAAEDCAAADSCG